MMVNGGERCRKLDVEEADECWGMTRRDIQAPSWLVKVTRARRTALVRQAVRAHTAA
jgi:hypothetical protein